MRYANGPALRVALEQRLLARSTQSGISLSRLRRRVVLERVLARIVAAEPGRWVLKGGMALEARLGDAARLTKDVDLGLRARVLTGPELHERLINAMALDPDGDHFVIYAERPTRLSEDSGGRPTWRLKLDAQLAGKPFDRIQLDVSPRRHELAATDLVPLDSSLAFAGIAAPVVEIVDVHRHAAEKLHGMQRDFGDRENTRVRDLVILIEHGLLDTTLVAAAARKVWAEREGGAPPARLGALPSNWRVSYPKLTANQRVAADTFPVAAALVARFWIEMFPVEEV